MDLTNEKMKNAIEKCHVIAPDLTEQQITAILYHAYGVFSEDEIKEGFLKCVSCENPADTATPDDADMCYKCFGEFNAACYDELKEDVKSLKNALHDVLKAVITSDNGVTDTIWVSDCVPIGDFIMGFFDEEIDLDELQNSPYRCKKTLEMFPEKENISNAWNLIKIILNPDQRQHLAPEIEIIDKAFIEKKT
jgi:uncharacterized CHY-type Zn-finger protein